MKPSESRTLKMLICSWSNQAVHGEPDMCAFHYTEHGVSIKVNVVRID
jgi:hypothetical protein